MKFFQKMINTKVFNSSAVFRVSVRTFSISNRNHRDKSVIYNCDNRPEPILDKKFREKVRMEEKQGISLKNAINLLKILEPGLQSIRRLSFSILGSFHFNQISL